MTRFIKIFTILTGLTLMTACGASGVLDDLKNVLEQAQAALSAGIKKGLLDERYIEAELAKLPEADRAAARANIVAAAAGLTSEEIEAELNLSEEELAEIEREAKFKEAVVGLNDEQQEARELACRVAPQTDGCDAVLVNICYDTPFDTACNANPDADRRVEYIAECGVGTNVECIDDAGAVCTGDSSITGCGAFVTRVCDANPLYNVCDTADYFVARDNACWIQGIDGNTRTPECAEIFRINNLASNAIPACRANYVDPTGANRFNPRCYNVVIAICDLNLFDVLCEENTNYTNDREPRIIACRNRVPNALFCDLATPFVCDENPFDALCSLEYTTNDYMSERQTAVNDCQTTFVAGLRCAGAAEEFCTGKTATDVTDLFSSLCVEHSATDAVRQPLCVGDRVPNTPISARCTETATRICDADPLDPLCDGVDGYFDAQLSACVLDSNNPSCVVGGEFQFAALESIAGCLAAPFDAACLNINTPQGEFFAPRAEAAQKAYCESGGARTTSTTVETTVDLVNCTNIGSSPVFADLARNITKNGITTYSSDGDTVTANAVTEDNPNIGGFLRTGVFGTKLGATAGKNSGEFTDENNNGNFDRGNHLGGAWTGLPADFGAGGDGRIFENNASKVDPNDGFTYFLAQDSGGFFLSYAGIWQTTNFGAPLAVRPADSSGNITAIWQGTFTPQTSGGVVQTIIADGEPLAVPLYSTDPVQTRVNINDRTTDFYVDFTARTFNFYNKVAEDGTGIVFGYTFSGGTGAQRKVPKKLNYSLDGVFGAGVTDPNDANRVLNAGELGGNVTLVIQPLKEIDGTNNGAAGTPIVMPLTGLIGVEGAVGVFLNPARTTSPNVGGFTAAPKPTPAE